MKGAIVLVVLAVGLALGPVATDGAASYKSRLDVVGREWSVTLSRATVRSPALVEFSNFGKYKHNLWFKRGSTIKRMPTVKPGERVRRRIAFARGTWTVYCELPGHEMLGMRTTLRVR